MAGGPGGTEAPMSPGPQVTTWAWTHHSPYFPGHGEILKHKRTTESTVYWQFHSKVLRLEELPRKGTHFQDWVSTDKH